MLNWFRKKRKPDPWIVAEGEADGLPLIVRMREAPPPGVDTQQYPHLVTVCWTFDGSDTGGLPGSKLLNRMSELEDRLDALEGADLGYMMVSLTGSGQKTWLWYVRNIEVYMEKLNEAIGRAPVPYPIELEAAEDPGWESFQTIRNGGRSEPCA
jgi:hypothetical protein